MRAIRQEDPSSEVTPSGTKPGDGKKRTQKKTPAAPGKRPAASKKAPGKPKKTPPVPPAVPAAGGFRTKTLVPVLLVLVLGFALGFFTARFGGIRENPAITEKAATETLPPPLPDLPRSLKLFPRPDFNKRFPPASIPAPAAAGLPPDIRPVPPLPAGDSLPAGPERPQENEGESPVLAEASPPPPSPPPTAALPRPVQPADERQAKVAMLAPAAKESAPALREKEPGADGFVFVPGGEFLMGNERGFKYEKPVRARLVKDFYIAPGEVTRKEWKAVMGSLPTEGSLQREAQKSLFAAKDAPGEEGIAVDFITWYEAVSYCNSLSRKEGLEPVYRIDGEHVSWNEDAGGYRLPTEEEWEYAAREGLNGRGLRFSGSAKPGEVGRYSLPPDAGPGKPGTLKANLLGVFDMSGNVSEWCWNVFRAYDDADYGKASDAAQSGRCVRGGSWMSDSISISVSARSGLPPNARQRGVGLRLVRNG